PTQRAEEVQEMRKLNLSMASSAVVLALAVSSPAFAQTVTLQGSDLAGLNYSATGAGTATGSTGDVVLSAPNPNSGFDTAMVNVPNGYSAPSGNTVGPLGTLSTLLAAGAAGNV